MKHKVENQATKTEAFVYTGIDQKVSFPGSDTLKDILTVMKSGSKKIKNYRVHQGIWKALDSIYPAITALLDKNNLVTISGHSLGGGLAQVLAYRLHVDGYKIKSLSVDGAVRVFNREMAFFVESSFPCFWREYGNDPVPLLFSLRYDRCGMMVRLKPRTFPWIQLSLNKDHMGYWE